MVVMRDQYSLEVPNLGEALGHCSGVYQDADIAGLNQQAGMAKMRDLHAGLSPVSHPLANRRCQSTIPRIDAPRGLQQPVNRIHETRAAAGVGDPDERCTDKASLTMRT